MRKTILYSSAIFAISALLISTGIFAVDAKTFDREESEVTKALGVNIDTPDFDLKIDAISKEESFVVYAVDHSGSESSFGVCLTDSKILKNSGLGKMVIDFNTSDLDCFIQNGPEGDISIEMKGDGPATVVKLDEGDCFDEEGTEMCFSKKGLSKEKDSSVNGSAIGEEISDLSGTMSTNDVRYRVWTNP
jgi:hypothetical protein